MYISIYYTYFQLCKSVISSPCSSSSLSLFKSAFKDYIFRELSPSKANFYLNFLESYLNKRQKMNK